MSFLNFIIDSTTGFLSLYLVLAISYFYSDALAGENFTLRIVSMVAACACFIASFGGEGGSLTLSCFGTTGVFTAMVCSVLATRLFLSSIWGPFRRYRSYSAGKRHPFPQQHVGHPAGCGVHRRVRRGISCCRSFSTWGISTI